MNIISVLAAILNVISDAVTHILFIYC